jgi:hypothetical protein
MRHIHDAGNNEMTPRPLGDSAFDAAFLAHRTRWRICRI